MSVPATVSETEVSAKLLLSNVYFDKAVSGEGSAEKEKVLKRVFQKGPIFLRQGSSRLKDRQTDYLV